MRYQYKQSGSWISVSVLAISCMAFACTSKKPNNQSSTQPSIAGQAGMSVTGSGSGGTSSGGSSAASDRGHAGGGGGTAGTSSATAHDAGSANLNTAHDAGGSGGHKADDAGGMSDAGGGPADSGAGHAMKPIDPPVKDDCITDVTAGDHTFSCSGLTFLVMVDEMCTHFACGLIFDVHGATMSGAQMRDNTLLHKLAPSKGYLVVHPSATAANTGGTWDLTNDPPKVADFMDRMMKAFHVDTNRVHFTGFSQGGAMSWWFLCNHNAWLASAAPVAGALNTMACMDASWSPRVPILNMNGIDDQASVIANSRTLMMNVVSVLGLTGGAEIGGDGHYSVKHWEGADGMVLDSIEHDYGGQAVLGGHCIPGGVDVPGSANNFSLNATTCTTGNPKLNWGEYVLQWFIDHPRK